jgi:hypothetical protein
MEKKILLLVTILSIVIILWFLTNGMKEGFLNENDLIDRSSPLAIQQNPLTNPVAQPGITVQEANSLRNLMQTALNIPTANPTGTGSFTYSSPENAISPRIDDENSLLGLVEFCKKRGKEPNPFSDPKFVSNCGMCLTSGTLVTGESFDSPTGVLVYQKDKEKAFTVQQNNKTEFPRVIPSLQAATCKGASVGDDSLPVLAINDKSYVQFKKRIDCKENSQVGNDCGVCQTNKQFSWIDPAGSLKPVKLVFYGQGSIQVSINSQIVRAAENLSETTPAIFNFKTLPEGSVITMNCAKGGSMEGPYMYGALESSNPNGTPFRIALEKIIEKDTQTGSTPKKGNTRFFTQQKLMLTKMIPGGNSDRMVLEGKIPFTFVEADQLSAYDCPGPYITQKASAELLIDDPCLRPSNQVPGAYTKECLQQKVIDVGCSSDGNWFKNPLAIAGNMNLGSFMSFLRDKKKLSDPQTSLDCSGEDIRTPCDAFIGKDTVPSRECMIYIYKNASEKNRRLGRTYKSNTSYTSLNGKTLQFCQPEGSLNPENSNGLTELTSAAGGYKGYKGLEGVKQYLSDIYDKATSNLDINISDAKGGKKDSFQKCFGLSIAEVPPGTVRTNASGSVQNKEEIPVCDTIIPPSISFRRGNLFRSNFSFPENYTFSFSIQPFGTRGGWSNIFRFGIGADWSNTMHLGTKGERALGIWFFPGDTRLHVRIGVQGDGNWGIDTERLPRGQVSNVRITCQGSSVSVSVNSNVISVQQPAKRYVGNVNMWASDPGYEPVNASVSNICFSRL